MMISKLQMALMVKTLMEAGASWMPYERQTLDANGMPAGEPQRVGCLMGLEYRNETRMRTPRIELPGTLLTEDAPTVVGVLPENGRPPMEGDRLCTAGTMRRVLRVNVCERMVTLTLEN